MFSKIFFKSLFMAPNVIVRPPYFDAEQYMNRYEDLRQNNVNPELHFLRHGDLELRSPSIYFDPDFYVSAAPVLRESGEGPLGHYLRVGARERRSPTAYFDPKWYAAQIADESTIADLFLHYITEGWRLKYSPSPYFDVEWYLGRNRDVAEAGVEPLKHYIEFGFSEGRQPNPYFDPTFYREASVDVRQSGIEPLKHYVRWGWQEKDREPNLYFDKEWYAKTYMGELAASTDPLRHFIEKGQASNISPTPRFEPEFYMHQSPEVGDGDSAYLHFLQFGQHAGRRPNAQAPKSERGDLMAWAHENKFRGNMTSALRSVLGPSVRGRSAATAAQTVLARVLGQVNAVSFDVFDTLVERISGAPETVFGLVATHAAALGYPEDNFVDARIRAERRAREFAGNQEIRLADIYEEFRRETGCSESVAHTLQDAEVEQELAVCVAKPLGRMLFDMAMRAEKTIFLVSDIYLSQDVISRLVANCGYSGFAKLYVSSELGATKHYGGMYTHLLADSGLSPRDIVHIGDNKHSDGDMARAAGLHALIVPKPERQPFKSALGSRHNASRMHTLWRELLDAAVTTRTAKSALSVDLATGREPLAVSVGTRVLGPLLLNFSLFLAKRAELGQYDKLFFASRDGFYLMKAYDIVRSCMPNAPESQYFYASRKVCRYATIRKSEDIAAIASVDHFPMPVHNFLTARFMLDEVEIAAIPGLTTDILDHVVVRSTDDKTLRQALLLAEDRILTNAKEHSQAYLAYLASIGLGAGRCAIVDVGYRGTVQRSLSELLSYRLGGIYLMVWPAIERLWEKGLRFDAFMRLDQNAADIINRNLFLLELLLSGTHPSISRFTLNEGKPVPRLMSTDTTPLTRQTLNTVRQEALGFVREVCEAYSNQIALMPVDAETVFASVRKMLLQPPLEFADGLREHVLEDDFGGETRRLVVSPGEDIDLKEALDASGWKEGTVALWKAERRGLARSSNDAGDIPIDTFDGYVSRAAIGI